jgi:hypothetical protein
MLLIEKMSVIATKYEINFLFTVPSPLFVSISSIIVNYLFDEKGKLLVIAPNLVGFQADRGSCIDIFAPETTLKKFMRQIVVSLRGIWFGLRQFPGSLRQKNHLLRLFHKLDTNPS